MASTADRYQIQREPLEPLLCPADVQFKMQMLAGVCPGGQQALRCFRGSSALWNLYKPLFFS